MNISIVSFSELSTKQLYEILELRSAIFVVEQECIYQDVDGKDENALHVLGIIENEIIAYARILKPGDYFDNFGIGRVLVKKNRRKSNFGQLIMKATIDHIQSIDKKAIIELSAQTYLTNFYKNLGFAVKGEEYLEDGISHIKMTLT